MTFFMNFLKKLLFVLIVLQLCFINHLVSQTHVVTEENGQKVTEIENNTISLKRTLRYKGSILFTDIFEIGKFSISGGQTFDKPILFNILDDNFIVEFNDEVVSLSKIDFTLAGHNFEYKNGYYLEKIFDGKLKLYIRYYCKIKPNEKFNYVAGYDGEIIRKNDYFLLFPDGKLRSVNLTKASIKSTLLVHYPLMGHMLKDYHDKIKNKEDIIKILADPELQDYFL